MAAERITLLCCEVDDQAGTMQAVLAQVAAAGIDLLAALGTEAGGGKSTIYALPKPGQPSGGFTTCEAVHVTGPDHRGAAAAALEPLAAAGVNMRTCIAIERGGQMQMVIVVDDVDAALAALR